MKKPVLLLLLSMTWLALPAQAEEFRMVHKHQDRPGDCETLEEVEAAARKSWWHGFIYKPSYEHKARKQLVKRARKAGGNGVHITEHRAFLGPENGDGIQRVEEKGMALDCDTNSDTDNDGS